MRNTLAGILSLATLAPPAAAQEATPVYQQQRSSVHFRLDGMVRQEWTDRIFVSPTQTTDESRQRYRLLPSLELGGDSFKVGIGGDFQYSSDTNTEPKPALIRDNYKSRDARLDLAFASFEPARWLRIEGGRFEMPVALTEMTWDRDLRPQGAALTLQHKDAAGVARAGVTVLGARGSHVFDDNKTDMLIGSGQLTLPGEGGSSLQMVGSFLWFDHLDGLEPMIRRQNTRVGGAADEYLDPTAIKNPFHVVDLVARIRTGSAQAPVQLVADYCWNAAVSQDNHGLWLAAVLGELGASPGVLSYVYSKVDKDATVAAYATDDFFWSTGWEGHRAEIGARTSEKVSIHVIGQLQRFKDSARIEERDHWVRRLRIELRTTYGH